MKMWGSFFLSILFCFWLSAGFARATQPYVFGRADIPTATTPDAIATADFDGDGNPDLAVVNYHYWVPVRTKNGTPAHRQVSISRRSAAYVSVVEPGATPSVSR